MKRQCKTTDKGKESEWRSLATNLSERYALILMIWELCKPLQGAELYADPGPASIVARHAARPRRARGRSGAVHKLDGKLRATLPIHASRRDVAHRSILSRARG